MKREYLQRIGLLPAVTFIVLLASGSLFGQVKVYEGTETIPTYKMGKDETSPIFYSGRGVQGAQGKIYPYPSQTKLGSKLVDVDYDMVYLENEYIKVKVLPAFGGRLFSAIDKTNGHEMFHVNSVRAGASRAERKTKIDRRRKGLCQIDDRLLLEQSARL